MWRPLPRRLNYLSRLLRKGYRVAMICETRKVPKLTKKIVRREVTRGAHPGICGLTRAGFGAKT